MAYVSAEKSKAVRMALKAKFPGWKFSVRKSHGSMYVTVLAAPLDLKADRVIPYHERDNAWIGQELEKGNVSVNNYRIDSQWQGESLAALQAINAICNDGNWDKSDIQSDYFNVGWYVNIEFGNWDKPFVNQKAGAAVEIKEAA